MDTQEQVYIGNLQEMLKVAEEMKGAMDRILHLKMEKYGNRPEMNVRMMVASLFAIESLKSNHIGEVEEMIGEAVEHKRMILKLLTEVQRKLGGKDTISVHPWREEVTSTLGG